MGNYCYILQKHSGRQTGPKEKAPREKQTLKANCKTSALLQSQQLE